MAIREIGERNNQGMVEGMSIVDGVGEVGDKQVVAEGLSEVGDLSEVLPKVDCLPDLAYQYILVGRKRGILWCSE